MMENGSILQFRIFTFIFLLFPIDVKNQQVTARPSMYWLIKWELGNALTLQGVCYCVLSHRQF